MRRIAVLLAAAASLAAAHAAEPPGTRTMRAADFLDTLGVNTHVGSPHYNDPAQMAAMLALLGIGNIRQSAPTGPGPLATLLALGRSGARIDLIVNGGGPVDLPGAIAAMKPLAGMLNAVEGVNEAAIWPIRFRGLDGVDAVIALQKALFAAVKAAPGLAAVPVYIFTLGGIDPGAFPAIGDMSAFADYANVHSYPPHGLRPCFVIHAAIDGGRTSAARRPVVVTETGYYTMTGDKGWGGVPEAVQASYLLGLVLDEAAAGVARTYLYDLIDDTPDPEGKDFESHFGLFRADGAPKPAAMAFHVLTGVLADPGARRQTFPPPAVSYATTGIPYGYTGNSMAFQKSDGTQVIAVWNEQQVWDPDTQAYGVAKRLPISVTLPRAAPIITVVDPTVGPDPVATLTDTDKVYLDLTDHPLLIVLPAPQAATPVRDRPRPKGSEVRRAERPPPAT